ncbi:MAG: c-type cytochrome domain-containing protein [Pirellulaceae bacterium]
MKRIWPWLGCVLGVCSLTQLQSAEPVSFRKDIAPILQDACIACHGPKKAEGGYRVDSYERAVKAGDSGTDAFAAGKLDDSEAFRRMTSTDADERMPLEADPLPAEQIALFKRWLEEGAKFDGSSPTADLVTIIPAPTHPEPPASYPFAVPVTAVAFSLDGEKLFVGGYHELTVWNVTDGTLVQRIKNVGQRSYALAVSPDGSLIAVGCGAPGRLGETRVFATNTGELKSVVGSTGDVVLDVAFSPAGDRLAVGAADGIVRVFDVSSGNEALNLSSHSDWVTAVAWNADGTRLGTASRDKTAKVFDSKTGELVVTYSGHGQPVRGIAFHPEGKEAYSSGGDNKIHRWQLADAKKTAEIGFGGEVYKLVCDSESLVAGSADKTVRQFQAKTHSQVRQYPGHADWVLSVAYSLKAKRIASGAFDGVVRVWNAEDGKAVSTFLAAPGLTASKP